MIDKRTGYKAMMIFLHHYWERSGKPSGDLSDILSVGSIKNSDLPLDQAFWEDWLLAIDEAAD